MAGGKKQQGSKRSREEAEAEVDSEEEQGSQLTDSSQEDGSQLSGSDDEGGDGDDSFPEVSSDEEGSGGDEDEGSEDEEDGDVKEIQVEFEFFSPEEKDFLGLKTLLTNYLNGEQFDSSGLVDAIIAEGDVGSVVKTDEDDDPIAVMTVLNTTQFKDAAFMKQLKDFLTRSCPKAKQEQLIQAFQSAGTGLIVNERLLNAPPKLGPPLVQFLMQDIDALARAGEEHAERYQFKQFLLATRVYTDTHGSAAATDGGASTSRPAKKSKQEGEQQQQLVFVRPEDEFFHKHCTWSYIFPVEGRPITKDGLLAHRLVLQIDADKVPAARAELDEVVGNMAAGVGMGEEAEGEEEEEEAAAGAGPSRTGGKGKSRHGGMTLKDVERMAQEMFASAAAAGAGKGAKGSKKKDKQKKAGVKAVTL